MFILLISFRKQPPPVKTPGAAVFFQYDYLAWAFFRFPLRSARVITISPAATQPSHSHTGASSPVLGTR